MKTKVTIQDIADELGLSRNTVSKAINNTGSISESTRDRILRKAVEMGYKQFSYLQAQKETDNAESECKGEIALLTTKLFNQSHFASVMLDRLIRELSLSGYTLNFYLLNPESIQNLSLPRTFLPARISGLICFELFDYRYGEMLCSLGLPTLFVDGPCKREGKSLPCDQLYMENTVEITRLVRDLLARGERKIGFLGNWEHCQSFYERYLAFRNTMLMEGVTVEERFLLPRNKGPEMSRFLNMLETMPDVFLCANDFVAMDAMYVLRKRGIRVPEDVLFCGFDDSPESRLMNPALTTVHIHTQIMAYEAARLLLSRIKEPSLDYRIVYTETCLIERESSLDSERSPRRRKSRSVRKSAKSEQDSA